MAETFIDAYREVIKNVADKATNLINTLQDAAKEKARKEAAVQLKEMPKIETVELTPGQSHYDEKNQIVDYMYKPGDTFGQVILDLGLQTDNGLWGENGDVAYYTKQLNDQGITGNIPVGTVITLRHRNAPAVVREEIKEPEAGKMVQKAKYPPLQEIIRSGARKV